MKKMLFMGLACMLAFVPTVSTYAAEETPQTCHVSGCNMGECFVDADCDGICGDHYFIDENGDGICDNHCYLDDNSDGICDYYADADEDGICDHCHDHGKPVQSTYVERNTQRSTATYSYSGGHHSSHHSRSSGHHNRHH